MKEKELKTLDFYVKGEYIGSYEPKTVEEMEAILNSSIVEYSLERSHYYSVATKIANRFDN